MLRPLSPARQRLVVRYLPLARSLAQPFKADWPGRHEELVSAADLALCESAARYRQGTARFSTYAQIRILYGLMDQVRSFVKERQRQNTSLNVDALPEGTHRRTIHSDSCVGAELEAAEEIEFLIDGFAENHRPLIRLLFVDGLTHRQAAQRLGVGKTEVFRRLRTAIQSRDSQCA